MTLKIKTNNSHFENLHTSLKKWKVCGVWPTTFLIWLTIMMTGSEKKEKSYLPPHDTRSISFSNVTLIQTSKAWTSEANSACSLNTGSHWPGLARRMFRISSMINTDNSRTWLWHVEMSRKREKHVAFVISDQFRFLGNCPPTPPLCHHLP